MKIGILGFGKMGEALFRGLQKSGSLSKYSIDATTKSKESAAEVFQKLKIRAHNDNAKLIRESDVVILCVKPHQAKSILSENSKHFSSKQLLISICASLTTEFLFKESGGKVPVVRAMPNTPCLIGEGMTCFCAGSLTSATQLETAGEIFRTVGKTVTVEEALMDGVTGLSGCGPAYTYLIIEALSEAGVKVGLPRKVATLLAAQTLLGASKMVLERGEHPAALKDEVTTPAGCTIDGLMALEEGKLRVTLIKAVLAAAKRSRTLAS